MNLPENSGLGRATAYPEHYDPGLLFPIPRAQGRAPLGLAEDRLPFTGHDRWHAYELAWLNARGKPEVATATFLVPAGSPSLVESKSLKLYLNSLNATRFDSAEDVRARIAADLTGAAGAQVDVAFGLPPMATKSSAGSPDKQAIDEEDASIDAQDIAIDHYGPPDASLLHADPDTAARETLRSHLLKSNCPVTGQPDWASLHITYRGPRIDRAGLLRYLVSFRDHAGFHEQCVEQVFCDLMARCHPDTLSVQARYTRRGGLDINPWRATPGHPAPRAVRDLRQ